MNLLCWKYCPARESCGYCCSTLGRLCCVRSSESKDNLPDALADTKNSRLHVRRISRIDSSESLDTDGVSEEMDPADNRFLSPASATAASGNKYSKKLPLHKRAIKTMMKKGHSTPNLEFNDGNTSEGKEESFKKQKRHFPKYLLTSSSDDVMNEEKEETESKHRLITMLKESRKKAREGNKEKQQMLEMHLSPDQALLPHPSCRRDLDGFQDENPDRISRTRQGYGSLLQIPTYRDEGSDFALSDEDQYGSRSSYGESQERLLEGETAAPNSYSMSDLMSLPENMREEGDGSSMDVGSKDNPSQECYGSVTMTIRSDSQKGVNVGIHSLQGLPCRKGRDGGLSLDIIVVPGGKTVSLPLPQAQGPKVTVNSDVTVKISHSSGKSQVVRICVWASGRRWKHCALGNAIVPVPKTEQQLTTVGLYQHTEISKGYGLLEISLESESSASSKATITLQILRAKFSKDLIYEKSINSLRSIYKRKRDVWCRISVWSKGHRNEKVSTPRIYLPVTYDPCFRSKSKFYVDRSMLPFTSFVIKVLCDKGFGLGEVLLGKLVLGPHLYLGVAQGNTPPGTLSHWGKALTHTGPVTSWHALYQ